MISLKDLEDSSIYIESTSREEDKNILVFLNSHGYQPSFDTYWYNTQRAYYIGMCFGLTKDHLIYINTDTNLTTCTLEGIEDYYKGTLALTPSLSIGDTVFIKSSKYFDIQSLFGTIKGISNYKDIITYRVEVYQHENAKTDDKLFLFKAKDLVKIESVGTCKAGKEAILTTCDDVITKPGYNISELYDKENTMKLLEIYRDRKMEKLFEDTDKAQSKAWEKNSTYKALKDLSEKTKTKNGYLFTFNFDVMPDLVREEIDKIQKDREEKEVRLNRLIKEVEAQLQECETYEQKINILKAYEILDEKGKVNA